jgi:hypothetical protein
LEYLFGTGTVAGLRVDYDATTEEIVVQPGLALDPLGRLIEVARPRCIRLRKWFDAQRPEDRRDGWLREGGSDLLIADVFVRFVAADHGKTPAFAFGPFDALDAAVPSRLRDDVELGLVIREEAGARRQAIDAGDPNPPELPEPNARAIELGLPEDPAARLTAIEDLIFSAWRDGTSDWDNQRPPRLIEHLRPRAANLTVPIPDHTLVGRDPTSVLLARLRVAVNTTVTPVEFGSFTASATNPDNRIRRFIYHSGITTRPANRGAP